MKQHTGHNQRTWWSPIAYTLVVGRRRDTRVAPWPAMGSHRSYDLQKRRGSGRSGATKHSVHISDPLVYQPSSLAVDNFWRYGPVHIICIRILEGSGRPQLTVPLQS